VFDKNYFRKNVGKKNLFFDSPMSRSVAAKFSIKNSCNKKLAKDCGG
jgi:hypothetical protein